MHASPLVRTVANDALGTRRSRRVAWLTILLNALAIAVVGADAAHLDGPQADPVATVAPLVLVGLFVIAETATVRPVIQGLPIPVTLRVTPFVVGVFFLAPIEVAAAAVLGTTLAVLA